MFERDELQGLYAFMCRIRGFEEAVGKAVATGEVHGEMHLGIGHEGVGAVLRRHLRAGDAVVSTHRAHVHALALGVDPVQLLGEILERDGLNGGKGGHMHLFDPERSFMCTGIVGAGVPIAAGYALGQSFADDGSLTVAVMGDGTMNQGAVFETMNLAMVRRLPLLFLCEDNGYSISVKREVSTAGELRNRGQAFGIPGFPCVGWDVDSLHATLAEATTYTRENSLPSLVVASVHRFRGHYEGDPDLYRSPSEKRRATAERDPLLMLRARLVSEGISEQLLGEIEGDASQAVTAWEVGARKLPFAPGGSVRNGVFSHG